MRSGLTATVIKFIYLLYVLIEQFSV